jgi:hypothetical protein
MTYYPQSQIKTNLYTNGNEYALSTTKQNYTGYYYQVSNGKKYTGKTPNDGPNILLIPPPANEIEQQTLIDSPNQVITYDYPNVASSLINTYPPNPTLPERIIPPYQITLPTAQEQSLGVFTRYFCKKTNENIYIEIKKETYTQLKSKDPKIAWDLYEPQSLLWQIKGNKEQTYTTNKNMAKLIEQNQKWYGFTQYFKEDFLKYYLGS